MMKKFKLAISFCDENIQIAFKVQEKIGNPDDIFIYKKFESLIAFNSGVDIFSEVFLEAEFVLILYSQQYGHTNYTALELSAIKERFLTKPQKNFLLCKMDSESKLPTWVTSDYIYYKYESDGLDNMIDTLLDKLKGTTGGWIQPTPEQKFIERQQQKNYNQEFYKRSLYDPNLVEQFKIQYKHVLDLLWEKFSIVPENDLIKHKSNNSLQQACFMHIGKFIIIFIPHFSKTLFDSFIDIEVIEAGNNYIEKYNKIVGVSKEIVILSLDFYIDKNSIVLWKNKREGVYFDKEFTTLQLVEFLSGYFFKFYSEND